jgi:PPOX class probable FMN-dependent enzyme
MIETSAPWRAPLLKALHLSRSKPEAKYIQIATVDSQSQPDVRTVVFRGFHNDEWLTIHSDLRSSKNQQLLDNNQCSIAWYFAKTREQFRFQLTAKVIDNQDSEHQTLVEQHWRNLSDAARAQYAGPAPASKIESREEGDSSEVSTDHVDDNFSVILLTPKRVDYLDLRTDPQTRVQFEKSGGEWVERTVNA